MLSAAATGSNRKTNWTVEAIRFHAAAAVTAAEKTVSFASSSAALNRRERKPRRNRQEFVEDKESEDEGWMV